VQATGEENNIFTDTVAVQGLDRDDLDACLWTRWKAVKTTMTAGDEKETVRFFAINNQDVFRLVHRYVNHVSCRHRHGKLHPG